MFSSPVRDKVHTFILTHFRGKTSHPVFQLAIFLRAFLILTAMQINFP